MLKTLLSHRSAQITLVLVVVVLIGISGVFSVNPSTDAFIAQHPGLAVLCVFLGNDNSDASRGEYQCFTRSLLGSPLCSVPIEKFWCFGPIPVTRCSRAGETRPHQVR